MNKYLSVFVGSLILVLSQDIFSTELMLLTSEPRVTVLSAPAKKGNVPVKFTVSQSQNQPTQADATARAEAVSIRLENYPKGTVALVFWDASNNLQGVLPVLPQRERMPRRFRAQPNVAFEPSVQIIEFPEDLAAQFDRTDVWQKSSNSNVEYLASLHDT